MSKKEDAIMYKMKVAVALACLRTKPEGVSGQEYAKQLCDQFQTSQLQWKRKLERNEREMLHLRQQLAVYQHQQSQSQVGEDSSLSSSQPLFPTPPPSGNPNMDDCEQIHHKETSSSLTRHMSFLHHVITLQTGSKRISDKSMESLVHLSLLHSLDLLKELHDGNDYVWRLQTQCVNCLEKLLKHVGQQLRTELLVKTGSVAGEIIQRLASDKKLNEKVRAQQSGLIIHLGSISAITGQILEHLTVEIGRFSDHLREALANVSSLDPHYYSSMYLILDTTDRCLCGQSISTLEGELRKQLVHKLENCVMFLSDTFPLFTLAVWRLCCKLSS